MYEEIFSVIAIAVNDRRWCIALLFELYLLVWSPFVISRNVDADYDLKLPWINWELFKGSYAAH